MGYYSYVHLIYGILIPFSQIIEVVDRLLEETDYPPENTGVRYHELYDLDGNDLRIPDIWHYMQQYKKEIPGTPYTIEHFYDREASDSAYNQCAFITLKDVNLSDSPSPMAVPCPTQQEIDAFVKWATENDVLFDGYGVYSAVWGN